MNVHSVRSSHAHWGKGGGVRMSEREGESGRESIREGGMGNRRERERG